METSTSHQVTPQNSDNFLKKSLAAFLLLIKNSGLKIKLFFYCQELENLKQESFFKKSIFYLRYMSTKIVTQINRYFKTKAMKRSLPQSRTKLVQKRLRIIKLIRLLAIAILCSVLLGVLGFFALFAWYSRELPKIGGVRRDQGYSTKIFDRNGQLLYDLYETERRNAVKAEDLPKVLKDAVVAIEDKDFYKHKGYDLMTILRIPYYYITKKGKVVGGSTITQQLVKNALLTSERKLSRKFKEIILAIQIDRSFTKDEILALYLNEAPYGGTAWGVATAAEMFFQKEVKDLNLVEAAILAGLPQRPSAYSPYFGKKDSDGQPLWQMRTKGVLRRMLEDSYITKEQYDQALIDLENVEFKQTTSEIKAAHFVFYVKEQLVEMFGDTLVDRGGLKVTTTLDYDRQRNAEIAVFDEIEKVKDYKISNGSAMAMDPKTGEILVMVGSKNFFDESIDGQFNVAVDGLRQPGSSIKPVTYLALIQRGYTPAYMFADVKTNFAPDEKTTKYEPRNYDGQYRGPVSLRNSLGSSLNVPAVKALAIVGVDNFLNLAYNMGFKTLEPTPQNLSRFGLAATLGGVEVHLIDSVTAYSAFANGGIKVEPVSILKVEDKDGNVIYEHKNTQGQQVMTASEAFLINNILSDNTARSLAFGTNSLLNTGKPIAVKTGTTNDQIDNWTIGWSRNVIVGSWVGNSDNSPMSKVASGVTGASPIWRNIIMNFTENGYETAEWEKPEDVEEVEVDKMSGYPAHDSFETKKDYAIKGTLPSLPDPIHSEIKVCKGQTDKLANEAKIGAGDYENKEFVVLKEDDPVSTDGKNRWQEGIDAWLAEKAADPNYAKYRVPTEYCGEDDEIYVKVVRPKDKEEFENEEIEIKVEASSGEGIDKIELYIDDQLRETIDDHEYKGKVHLAAGRHEIYAIAKSRKGKTAKSSKRRIGTGGVSWEEPDPTATPAPTTAPTTAPEPTSAPVPSPTGTI